MSGMQVSCRRHRPRRVSSHLVRIIVASLAATFAVPVQAASPVSCGGRSTPTESSFTTFLRDRAEGAVALRLSRKYYILEEGVACKVRYQAGTAFEFVLSNKTNVMESEPTFIGAEVVRIFRSPLSHSHHTYLFRNEGWHSSPGQYKRTIGVDADDFLGMHEEREPPDPRVAQWHAMVASGGPSSWDERELLLRSTVTTWNESPEADTGRSIQAQYKLIRFVPSPYPRGENIVRFTFKRFGAEKIIVRIFSPNPEYQGTYELTF